MNRAPPRAPGTYALLWRAPRGVRVAIGALGEHDFARGWYVYFGSARGGGGLAARIARHARHDKSRRWHMDYLRPALQLREICWQASETALESTWVAEAESLGWPTPVAGFGASDSPHRAHLFMPPARSALRDWCVRVPGAVRQSCGDTGL